MPATIELDEEGRGLLLPVADKSGRVPLPQPLALRSFGNLSTMAAAALALQVLYAIAAATWSCQIATIPLRASNLIAMPSVRVDRRIMAATLRGQG
jgi:hypothetical protein